MSENQPLSLKQKGLSSINRIQIVKSIPFRIFGVTIPETGDALLLLIYDCPPLSKIVPRRLSARWGLSNDPQDNEQVEMYLGFGDPDSGQSIGSIRNRAIWTDVQRWKVISSVGIFNTLENQPETIFTPRDEYSNVDLASRSTRLALSMYGFSTTSGSSVIFLGNLALTVVLFQRSWRGREVVEGENFEDAEWDESDDYDFDGCDGGGSF